MAQQSAQKSAQQSARQPDQPQARLKHQWWWVAGIYVAVLILGGIGLAQTKGGHFTPGHSLRWTLLAGLLLVVELIVLRRNLHKNRPTPASPVFATLGWGNSVTLARGAAYGLMAGFLFAPRPGGLLDWAPAILYAVAIVADYWDGYLARRTNHTTMLGEVLDIEFDGIGILIAMALAVQYGQLPGIILLLAVSRPLFLWGMKWRDRLGLPNHPMTPSDERRIAAGLIMGFMAIVLWPVFHPPATYIGGAIFGGMVAASFLRDWLVVIGWLQPTSPGYMFWHARLKRVIFQRLPLLLRLASLPAVVLVLWRIVDSVSPIPLLLIALGLLAGVAALLGFVARLAAIGLIALACADLIAWGNSSQTLLLLTVGLLLIVLGNGSLALWTPDERLLRRRAGVRVPTPKDAS